jgi:hypothetical protein
MNPHEDTCPTMQNLIEDILHRLYASSPLHGEEPTEEITEDIEDDPNFVGFATLYREFREDQGFYLIHSTGTYPLSLCFRSLVAAQRLGAQWNKATGQRVDLLVGVAHLPAVLPQVL